MAESKMVEFKMAAIIKLSENELWLWMFLILFVLILEGYFLQNRIIFDSVDKLSPVSNMAYSCLKKC